MAKKEKKKVDKNKLKKVKVEETEVSEVVEKDIKKDVKKNKKLRINKKNVLVLCCILFVIFLIITIISVYKSGVHEYPIIYKGKNNYLYLLKDGDKKEDAVVFSRRDGIGYISFFNNNPRYFLYKKSTDLYIYDVKKLEDKKIISDYSASFVTNNDEYVVAVDKVGVMYSYNLDGELKEIGNDLFGDVAFTDDCILYENSNDELYLSYLNGKEKDILIATEVNSYQFSKDGSKVVYINKDDELISYVIKSKKSNTINKNVSEFYCDSDSCDQIYYVASGDEEDIFFYNGKKSSLYEKGVNELEAVDVDANIMLFSRKEDNSYKLYIKNGNKNSVLIDDSYGVNGISKIFDAKYVYYVNTKKELKYYNISKKTKKDLESNISGRFILSKNGYYVFGSLNSVGDGTLYYLSEDKITKVNDNVYSFNYYYLNKEGDKLYYYKDYSNKIASLYVFDGNKSSLISDDVYMYQYINDKLIYFIKDYDVVNMVGDLYKFDGKEKVMITNNVQSLVQFNINQYRK